MREEIGGGSDLLETSLAPLPKEEMQKATLITARSHLYWVSCVMADGQETSVRCLKANSS